METFEGIGEAYAKVLELGVELEIRNITSQPGAWVHRVDGTWIIAVNPHQEELEVEIDGTMGGRLQSFEIGVWFNGWLTGILTPTGGAIAAGAAANEAAFIRALDLAITEARTK
jgi:hypothetical protein